MRRVMSVWLPNWPITRLQRAGKSPVSPSGKPDSPFATIWSLEGIRRLSSVNEAAHAQGLRPGQKLADAQAILPALMTIDADFATDHHGLERLADWCSRFTPATAIDLPDGLWLDITGAAHLWGGEAELAQDLTRRLELQSIPCRAAIADSFGAAWGVLRYAEDRAPVIVPPGQQRARLKPLPITSLRLDAQTVTRLHRLGLRRVSHLLALPRGDLARRFGDALTLRLDQALGEAEETIAFRQAPTQWFVRQSFAEPIATVEDLARVLTILAEKLCAILSKADRGGRYFEAAFHRVDSSVTRITIGLALPNRLADRIAHLLGQKMDQIDPGFGIELATLTAADVEPLTPAQLNMSQNSAGWKILTALTPTVDPHFIDSLGNRLGFRRLWRNMPQESHLPERSVIRVLPTVPPGDRTWPSEQIRPTRLLRRPEPIEATALIPDNPPVQFRWRKIMHRVRRSEGPERIAYEWWRQSAPEGRDEADLIRDYYRVEDAEGHRFWIYRAGLYTEGRVARWYLHGFFA